MSSKHVFDSSDGLVLKALRGAVAVNPDLRLHASTKSVYAKSRNDARVALISGGGAGHEPAHAGYTGRGMLAASVSGDIFASPSASQILTCIQLALAAQQTNQVLLIVNNYTGDRLNFGLAAERARRLALPATSLDVDSKGSGLGKVELETVVVADDVSLLDRPTLVGPRGLAGNILVCKILGAAAESGLPLHTLKKLGDAIVSNLASIGVGLTHCHVPGRNASDEGTIEDGACELGLGLHNEPGARKMQISGAKGLVDSMLEQILTSKQREARARGEPSEDKSFVRIEDETSDTDEVVLYVNNLGGMSNLEMSAIVDEALSQLESRHIRPARVLLSSYMTSLNAPGFSLSILNLSAISRNLSSMQPGSSEHVETIDIERFLSFIDAPTEATAWAGVRTHWPVLGQRRDRSFEEEEASSLLSSFSEQSANSSTSVASTQDARSSSWRTVEVEPQCVEVGIRSACKAVLAAENDLTRFDTIVGDGDCGATFSSGARTVLEALDAGDVVVEKTSPAQLMQTIAELLVNSMGGTSGALFGLYFTALSNSLSSTPQDTDVRNAPVIALHALSTHTPARPGDRTIVDALDPFCHSLASGEAIEAAAKKAREGAESTRGMHARLGRATYISIGHGAGNNGGGEDVDSATVLPPDPGAWGVAALLEGLVQGLSSPSPGKERGN